MKVESNSLDRKGSLLNGSTIPDDILKDFNGAVWATESSKPVTDKKPAKVRLPVRQRACYSIGHVYNDLCASMWFTYTLLYYNLVLGFSTSEAGLLVLIGQVADAISTPFIGLASDRRNSMGICRYGRRKIWHLIGTVCVSISFPFLFIHCLGCEDTAYSMQMIYYASFIIVFQFGWAAVQVSHLSLIPDLTKNPNEKTELSAYRNVFTVVSNICVYGIAWAVLGSSAGDTVGPNDVVQFRNIVLIITAIGIVFSAGFHFGVREPPLPPKKIVPVQCDGHNAENGHIITGAEVPTLEEPLAEKAKNWKKWLKTFEFYKVALLYMCTRLFGNLSQTYITLYLQESLQLPKDSVAYIPLVVYVSGFLASLFMKTVNKKAGRLISYVSGAVTGVGFCAWVFFGSGYTFEKYEIYGVAILMGASGSIILITCLGITADLIGDNAQSGAFVFGAMSFADKLSNGIVVVIVQYMYRSDPWYYRDVLTFGCGAPVIVALITVFTISKSLLNATKIRPTESDMEDSPVKPVSVQDTKLHEQNGYLNHEMTNGHTEREVERF